MIRSGEQGAILRDGDEWCYGEKEWAPVPKHWVGERAINTTNLYRRRVTPEVADIAADTQLSASSGTLPDAGEGWRMLGPDDVQQEGDEWCLTGKTWKPIPSGVCGNPAWCGEARYRRRATPFKPVEIDGDKPDVEDGWKWLEVGEVMACGDEVAMCNASGQVIQWVTVYEDSLARGNTVTPHLHRFCRRRVTPDSAWEQLRRKVDDVSSQANALLADALQKAASEVERLKAENATLRSGVELLGAEASTLRSEVESVRALTDAMRTDNVRLRSEVERLRLTPSEQTAIHGAMSWLLPQCPANFLLLESMLKRQGGGE